MASKTIFDLDLVEIAVWHRRCTVLALVTLFVWVMWILLAVNMSPMPIAVGRSMWLFYIGVVIMSVVFVVMLQIACGSGPVSVVLQGVLALVFSFLVLISSVSSAGTILRLAGARVGFFGVTRDEMDKLRRGHCRGCGYSREGLELLQECPECERVPRVI